MAKSIDLTGHQQPGTFITVVNLIEGSKPRAYKCRCNFNQCGKEITLTTSQITGDRCYKSCGCYKSSDEFKKNTRKFKNYVREW